MKREESIAVRSLKSISSAMDYELLVSRHGITEPDTDFIWASSFKAPIGVSLIEESLYFNLFLPKEAENDGDKKIFLKRVGAKLQDDLWQVHREMGEVTGNYGPPMQMAVTIFRSTLLDYMYIKNGRGFAHFVFNGAELEDISSTLLSVSGQVEGFRVEYLRRMGDGITLFRAIEESDKVSTLTVEISPLGASSSDPEEKETFFAMANVLKEGIKSVGILSGENFPEILAAYDVTRIEGYVRSFKCRNSFLTDLVDMLAKEFIICYGFYGSASNSRISLAMNVPTQQITSVMKILGVVSGKQESWKMKLVEITRFRDIEF